VRFAVVALATLISACEELPPGEYPNAGGSDEQTSDTAVSAEGDDYADTDPSALTDFHGALDAHGAWVEDDTYGTVWVPNSAEVGADFTPYVSGGHWAYDEDWVWVSDWEWGWAPFHYGRWVVIDGRGWVWIPGRHYAGAWVVWQTDGAGYVGWAAAPPYWYWRGGVAMRFGFGIGLRYVYCPRGEIFHPGLHERVFWGPRAVGISSGMRVVARPTPSSFGHTMSAVPRPNGNAGFSHAQQMSRPSSAAGLGARPASPHVIRSSPSVGVHSGGGVVGGGGVGHAVPSRGGSRPRGGGGGGHVGGGRGGHR
jgi:hypothetical protein